MIYKNPSKLLLFITIKTKAGFSSNIEEAVVHSSRIFCSYIFYIRFSYSVFKKHSLILIRLFYLLKIVEAHQAFKRENSPHLSFNVFY